MDAEFADAWGFGRLDAFWTLDQPQSLIGRELWNQRKIYCDSEKLESLYDETERAMRGLQVMDDVTKDRLAFHLKRLPLLPDAPSDLYELAEILQVKRFLYHAQSLSRLLDADLCKTFEIQLVGSDLWALLAVGGMAESFYVADEYDSALVGVRKAIRALDEEIARIRQTTVSTLAALGLDLSLQDFAIVDAQTARKRLEQTQLITVEPFDAERSLVRLVEQPETLDARSQRAELLAQEAALESRVIGLLSKEISLLFEELKKYERHLCAFDCALWRARLAEHFGLSRPRLTGDWPRLENARFYPCEQDCLKLQFAYKPLSWTFDAPVHVLFGSNMGGKTTALQTVVFFQLLAQSGLFVPADFYETRVYAHCRYIGELRGETLTGLSGFGVEIHRLLDVWALLNSGALVVFDEFARTTSSMEAEALLSALTTELTLFPQSLCIFASHFKGIERDKRVSFWRTEGLDRVQLKRLQAETLPERLRAINRCMRYGIVRDDGCVISSDALAIAQLLGLPESLCERAALKKINQIS